MAEAKPFVAYDVDGTIFKSSLAEKIVEAGIENGMFRPEPFNKVNERRVQWQASNNEGVYNAYLHRLVETLVAHMAGIEVERFMSVTESMIAKHSVRKFSFPKRLMLATADSHLQIAISGSPHLLVRPFLRGLPINLIYGADFSIRDGRFTGQATSVGDKADILQTLVDRDVVRQAGSIAVGDTVSDASMLEFSDRSIMFNPSRTLTRVGQQKRWPKVHEVKDQTTPLCWDERIGTYVEQSMDDFLQDIVDGGLL